MTQSLKSEDNKQNCEKRMELLLQIAKDSYDNHTKKANTSITISGFIITYNGILILANSNLIQFIMTNTTLFKHPTAIVIVSSLSILLSILSIFLSISFIHMINPISHDLSPFSDLMEPLSHTEILSLQSSTLFTIDKANEQEFQKNRKRFYSRSLVFMGGATGALLACVILISYNLIF